MLMGHVVVGAHVEVTRKALGRLVDTGVGVTFLDPQGRSRSRLLPPWKNTPEVRIGQYECVRDSVKRNAVCQEIVRQKIAAQLAIFQRAQSNYPDPAIRKAIAELKVVLDRLPSATSPAETMGMEGWAAKIYWQAFGCLLRCDWVSWCGRNRRPPLDPVNACLSYGYGILLNRVLCQLEAAGFDTYIGCLHETSGRHPSMGLDIMEPFRPALVDRIVLRLFNLGSLRKEHFEKQFFQTAVYLNSEGRLILLEAFEKESANAASDFYPNGKAFQTHLDKSIQNLRDAAKDRQMEAFQFFTSD